MIAALAAAVGIGMKVSLFVGTYTSASGSEGIYRCDFDSGTGEFGVPVLAAKSKNPSFLTIDQKNGRLFAVEETSEGVVSSYTIDGKKLKFINMQGGAGSGLCHVSLDFDSQTLFTAAYGSGHAASFKVSESGEIQPVATLFQNEGSGPNESRQKGPHMHSMFPSPFGTKVYACDLGTDEILMFDRQPDGTLVPSSPKSVKTVPGGGPRHLAFDRSGQFVYLANEMLCSVSVFERNLESGNLKLIQTIDTLPEGTALEGNSTAEIRCAQGSDFVYISNRGHDSITVFKAADDGKLTLVQNVPAGVKTPRGFTLDLNDKFLIVAGQDGGGIVSFKIDQETGMLTQTGSRIEVSKPVCVKLFRK